MFSRMHHVSYSVGDIDRSIAFYTGLGFKLLQRRRDVESGYFRRIVGVPDAIVHLAMLSMDDGQRLELIEYVQPRGADLDKANPNIGSTHLCLVTDDIEADAARMRAAGVRFKSEIVLVDEGPNTGSRAVYCLDPDGYTVELFSPAASS